MSVRKLKRKLERAQHELYELHFWEPSPAHYKMRREQLEYTIASLEDAIELEKKMLPFKVMLYGFIVIAFGLVIWAYAASN